MKVCKTTGRLKPTVSFDGSDTLEEIASVMKCSVFRLIRLIDDLYVQDYDGEKVTVQIRSKSLDAISEAIEKAHSIENAARVNGDKAALISPEGE